MWMNCVVDWAEDLLAGNFLTTATHVERFSYGEEESTI
jgi:hypothetical protein